MKCLILGSFIFSNLFASVLVPNIRRNQVESNITGAATGWAERNNLTLRYSQEEEENSKNSKDVDEDTDISLNAKFHQDKVSGELELERSKRENDLYDSEYKDSSVAARAGFLLNSRTSLGGDIRISNDQDDSNSDSSTFGASVGHRLRNDLIVGGGFFSYHSNGEDGNVSQIYGGVGALKENLSWEALLLLQGEQETEDNLDGSKNLYGKSSQLWLEVVYQQRQLEFFGRAVFSTYETHEDAAPPSSDSTSMELEAALEYLLTDQFALGFGASLDGTKWDRSNGDEDESSEVGFGPRVRYDNGQFQVLAQINFGDDEDETRTSTSTTKTEEELYGYQIDLTYFF